MPDPSLNPAPQPDEPLPTVSLGSEKLDTDSRRTQSTDIPVEPAATPRAKPSTAPAIPGYVITGEIARGGMGQVYAGRDLTLDREVAIKTLLPGANAERFVVESKITAKLPHPGIPPVHALGSLADGTPFLAMKLIRGRTLAALLKERASPQDDLPRFLQIFEQIAQAVGFAHAQGIIHRDLKPANVMVGAFGEVQVMDWGLAKELQSQNAEARSENEPNAPASAFSLLPSDFSSTGSICGTPGYMSPEQARGEPVDARTDVFALGSILAMILTGKPAFVGKTVPEIMKQSAAAELSDVLARLDASSADAELTTLAKRYLASGANQRPKNAQTVATEVAAYRASVEQRLRRAETQAAEAQVREAEGRKRRSVWIALTAILFIGVVAVSALAIWVNEARKDANVARANEVRRADSERKARVEERRAKEQTERRLEQIKKGNAIVNSIFRDFDIRKVKQGTEPIEAVLAERLAKAAEQLQGEAIGDPLVVAELQIHLAQSLLGLGHSEAAVQLLNQARATYTEKLGPDHPETLSSIGNLAAAYDLAGRPDLALPLMEESLNKSVARLGKSHPNTLGSMNNLAEGYRSTGKFDLALQLYREVLQVTIAKQGESHPEALRSLHNLAHGLHSAGQHELALGYYEKAFAAQKVKLGVDHPDTLMTQANLAAAYTESGQLGRGLPVLEESFQALRTKLGAEHPLTLASLNNLAEGYRSAGKLSLAIPLLADGLKARRLKLGAEHPDTLTSMNNLGLGYRDIGDLEQAIPLLEETLQLRQKTLGHEHPDTLISTNNLALGYQDRGNQGLALQLYEESVRHLRAQLGNDHPTTLTSISNLASAYLLVGRFAPAISLLEESRAVATQKFGADHPLTLKTMNHLAEAYRSAGKLDVPLLEETLTRTKAVWGTDHPNTVASMNNLAEGYRESGRLELALSLYEQALKLAEEILGSEHPDTLDSRQNLAKCLEASGNLPRALAMYEDVLERAKTKLGTDHPLTLIYANNLAACYVASGRRDKGLSLCNETLSLMREKLGPNHPETLKTLNNLAIAYRAAGKLDLALPLLEEALQSMRSKLGSNHPNTLVALNNVSITLCELKRGEEAASSFKTYFELLGKDPATDWRGLADEQAAAAFQLLKCEQFETAETLLRDCLSAREEHQPDSWSTFHAQSLLGEALLSQDKLGEAELLLLFGYDGLKERGQSVPRGFPIFPEAIDRLIKLYTALDKPDEVKKWQAEREKYPVKEASK